MTNNQKLKEISRNIGDNLVAKGWIYALLLAGLYMFYKLIFRTGIPVFLTFAALPTIAIIAILVLKYSKEGFYALFTCQFLLFIAGMYINIKMGVATLIVTLTLFSLFIIRDSYEKIDWTKCRNGMLALYLLWGIFCMFEILNPNNVQDAWNIAITHYFIYPIVCAILVPIAVRNIKGIEWLLIIWSIFVLVASFKGYWQKNHGFNEKENYFLFVYGGAKTHIIWSGIRYFSLFTDAANFGVHMAMAITTFSISAFYTKNKILKVYFLLIVIAATYGMGISGTRAAVAVPLGALILFAILSRNWRTIIIGFVAFVVIVGFFRFTTIGQGNVYVSKMRSAFKPSVDASYQVRVHNRKLMKEYMQYKPFGYGLGLSKGWDFHPKEVMPYPPDSWLVSVWVETGIIGLGIYLLIHGALFAWCSWIIMFKIMNKRLRGLLAAWLGMAAGFFIAAYANDVMQYPNSIVLYTGFALCFAGPYIDKQTENGIIREKQEKEIEVA